MEDSINKMSPPTAVQANPVTTPATSFAMLLLWFRPAPKKVNKSLALMTTSKVSSVAICFARDRTNFAICLSSPRTPDSLVYDNTTCSNAAFSISNCLAFNPCAASCFGIRCFFPISIFSSTVYPFTSMISIRSRSGPWMSLRLFAVAMKSTLDRSNSFST